MFNCYPGTYPWQEFILHRGSFLLDLRALALFRIAIGVSSLIEVHELWQHQDAFLSADGLCPLPTASGQEYFDLFLAAQTPGAVAFLLFLRAKIIKSGLQRRTLGRTNDK